MDFNVDNWSGRDVEIFRKKLSLTKKDFAKACNYTVVRLWQVEKYDLQLSNAMKSEIRKAFFTCNNHSKA